MTFTAVELKWLEKNADALLDLADMHTEKELIATAQGVQSPAAYHRGRAKQLRAAADRIQAKQEAKEGGI